MSGETGINSQAVTASSRLRSSDNESPSRTSERSRKSAMRSSQPDADVSSSEQ